MLDVLRHRLLCMIFERQVCNFSFGFCRDRWRRLRYLWRASWESLESLALSGATSAFSGRAAVREKNTILVISQQYGKSGEVIAFWRCDAESNGEDPGMFDFLECVMCYLAFSHSYSQSIRFMVSAFRSDTWIWQNPVLYRRIPTSTEWNGCCVQQRVEASCGSWKNHVDERQLNFYKEFTFKSSTFQWIYKNFRGLNEAVHFPLWRVACFITKIFFSCPQTHNPATPNPDTLAETSKKALRSHNYVCIECDQRFAREIRTS